MNTFSSAEAQHRALRAAWLAAHHRPCSCDGDGPLDLREQGARIECARCGRPWTPRRGSR